MSQIVTKFIANTAVTNAKVATGIDAAKIADGSVSNAEFQYLSGVTSDIQTQLNAASPRTWAKENLTLDGTDITNQYKDLAEVAIASSIDVVVNGVVQTETVDYTVNLTGGAGGNTRLTFAGDLATGGGAALVATDVLRVKYQY